MPSPFPGMNPYLERATAWESCRLLLTVGVQFQLVARVQHLNVRLAQHKYVHPPANPRDAEYVERIAFVTLRDRSSEALVTVVELLSPTQKQPGSHRESYLRHRSNVLSSGAHFVELDLLRDAPVAEYRATVSRTNARQVEEVVAWSLRDPFPLVPIPLREGEPDAVLDLKPVLDRVYDGGGYHYLAYTGPPEPRLAPDDAAWAAQFVPASS